MEPPMDRLAREEEVLRRAVSRHDFDVAALSARRYARLAAGLHGSSRPDAETLLRHACETLDWGRRTLQAARAHIAEDLVQLRTASCVVSSYGAAIPAPVAPVHTWKMEA